MGLVVDIQIGSGEIQDAAAPGEGRSQKDEGETNCDSYILRDMSMPGMTNRPIGQIAELMPAVWANRNSSATSASPVL